MTSSIGRQTRLQRVASLRRDERGVTAIFIGLMISALAAVVGLGVEAGMWFTNARALQTQADAAALAGAYALMGGSSLSTIQSTGTTEATNNGFANGSPNTIVITQITFGGQQAVEAVLTTPKTPTLLSGVSAGGKVNVQATAVAAVNTPGNPCIMALDPTSGDTGILMKGSVSVTMPNCIMASNTPGSSSISLQGASGLVIDVKNLYTVGSISKTGSPSYATNPANLPPLVGQAALTDPFSCATSSAYCIPKSLPPCVAGSSASTYGPGTYCNGIDLGGNLKPGIYYVDGGARNNQSITASSNSIGTGVTIVLTSSTTANKIPQLGLIPSFTLSLSAPTTGAFHGVVFYQDPKAPVCTKKCNSFTGNTNFAVNGAFYFPNQQFMLNGNSTTSTCTLIIARTVELSGNSSLDYSGCSAVGAATTTVQTVKLVM